MQGEPRGKANLRMIPPVNLPAHNRAHQHRRAEPQLLGSKAGARLHQGQLRNCMTQEPPKLLMEVLAHPLQIFTEQMLIVITYQMLSVAVKSNHDDQPRPALHDISLKWYKSLVLKRCFRPAPNEHSCWALLLFSSQEGSLHCSPGVL